MEIIIGIVGLVVGIGVLIMHIWAPQLVSPECSR